MYRIEVAPGEESVFRTIEELAVGIRNGVVTHRARIYHHASEKWLPISLHPHYKKALEMPAAKAAHPPVKTSTSVPAAPRATPRSAPRPEPRPTMPALEPKPAPRPSPVVESRVVAEPPRPIPPPVPSPIVAMQQEVLRDLPVVSIPEPRPLPWTTPAPRAAAPRPPEAMVKAHPTFSAQPTPLAQATPLAQPTPIAEHAVEQWNAAPTLGRWPAAEAVEHRPADPRSEQRQAAAAAESRRPEPAEPRHAELHEPVTPRPTARRSRRMSGRPMLLVGVAAALVIGAHLALTATRSPSVGATEPVVPAEADANEPAAPGPVAEQPQVTTAPARVPMSPGPAFAGSAPAGPGARRSDAPRALLPTPHSVSAVADTAPAIAPPPAALELALPLPPDSMVPSARTGDTLAMKKILRALNGTRP